MTDPVTLSLSHTELAIAQLGKIVARGREPPTSSPSWPGEPPGLMAQHTRTILEGEIVPAPPLGVPD